MESVLSTGVAVDVISLEEFEQRASSVLGSIECQPSPPRAGRSRAPVVRLTGHAVLGAVEIRFAPPGTLPGDVRASAPRLDKPRRVP
jgi:hypothetical protein